MTLHSYNSNETSPFGDVFYAVKDTNNAKKIHKSSAITKY